MSKFYYFWRKNEKKRIPPTLLSDPKSKKATRLGYKMEEGNKKVRVAKASGTNV